MLRLDTCCKAYGVVAFGGSELLAVSDVSFEVAPGEVVSLIGESGSGKSTIGKMILRLVRVTHGTITFDGVDVATLGGDDLKAYYGDVQGVFQDPFSSYNPIFKADRVFSLVRDAYYGGISRSEWDGRKHEERYGPGASLAGREGSSAADITVSTFSGDVRLEKREKR